MSIDAIVAGIERDAAAEAAAAVEAARATAEAMAAASEAAVAALVEAAVRRAEPGLRAAATRRINEVRLQALEARAQERAERVAEVFTAADRELAALAGSRDPGDGARWAAAVRRLATDALGAAGGGTLLVRAGDAEAAGAALGPGDELRTLGPEVPPGVRVVARDGRLEIDATMGVRLARARVRLADTVAVALGLDDGRA